MAKVLQCVAGGFLSGILLALALPPMGWWWLGPLCLVPVLTAVTGKGLLRGLIGGLCVPAGLVVAVQQSLFYHLGGPNDSKWILVGCGYFGILVIVVCCVSSEIAVKRWRRLLLTGAIGVLLELSMFPILPAHLALTQYTVPGMLTLASVGGIWLVSFVLWAANAALVEPVIRRDPALGVGTLISFFLIAGALQRPSKVEAPVKVAAIQTQATDAETLRRLNAEAGRHQAQVAVWPEFSGIELAPGGEPAGLRELSGEVGQAPFVTSYRDTFAPLPHNAAALFSGGEQSPAYFKRKLFGGEKNMHTPGLRAVSVPWRGGLLGLNVCYDSCYPTLIRDTADTGSVLVALPTIDPDSTNYFVAATHAAFTPFRAAETGVPIVRADGGAFSMVVDSLGRIVASKGPGEGVLVAGISLGRRFTLYSVLGDWMLYLCGGYVLFEIGLGVRSRRAKRAV